MTNTKIPFEERVPVVLKLIREAKEPISRKELYNKLKEETGVKISKTTFEKCLNYLLSTCDITKTEEKGPGSPVKFSINYDYFIYKTKERIAVSSYLLNYFSEDSSPYGTEANLWSKLSDEISDIVMSLVLALSNYSQRNDRKKAINEYYNTIETELVPHILELHKLVRPPVRMTSFTSYILFKLFYEDIVNEAKKPLHPLMSLTPEEKEKVNHLVKEKIDKNGIIFREEIPKSFDLSHIEEFDLRHIKNSEFIREYIKYVEMKREAFFEIRKYEENKIYEYPKIKKGNSFKFGSMKTMRFPNMLENLTEKDNIQSTQDKLNDFNLEEIINNYRK